MSSNESNVSPEAKAEVVGEEKKTKKHETLVDAVFDVGLAWAEYGISHGKHALEASARVLERTAKALDTIQAKLRSDAA
jgi:hypothetical protein